MKRAVIVQGLGFGDEGKGATVDFLSRELAADLVVRYCGGSQAGHNVVLPNGRRHAFSQFGAGTLAGAATYLGEQMIINLPAMHKEAQHLQELTGEDPFLKLSVHPRALVSTVYHQQLNRLRELSRGAGRHGSCGHGIGETRNYWLAHGQDAVVAADLKDREVLAGKMELLRQRVLLDAQELVDCVPADEHWRLECFMEPVQSITREVRQLAGPLEIQATLPACTTAIFEGAQGVLLDEWRGFHPHTTWSTVTLHHALAMIEENDADEVCTLGVTRAYMTRHGAGPLPTWSPELDAKLTDSGNPTNAWQGTIRRGWLDLMLLRYATESAGGPLDGLVIDCLDHLAYVAPQICLGYRCPQDMEIEQLPVTPVPWLAAQERLTMLLERAVPVFRQISLAALYDTLARAVAPFAITATGSTWQDRTLRELRFIRSSTATLRSRDTGAARGTGPAGGSILAVGEKLGQERGIARGPWEKGGDGFIQPFAGKRKA
ncbi:MAG: adenylosuccinate synthetase [Thermoguttaceae bacterium]